MRKVSGFLLFVAGLVGFLACVAGVIGTWWFRAPSVELGQVALTEVGQFLQSANEKLARARDAVRKLHAAVEPALGAVAKLAKAESDLTPAADKHLEEAQSVLLQKLDQLEGYVQLGQVALDVLSRTQKVSRNVRLPGSLSGKDLVEHAQGANQALSEISAFLKSFNEILKQVRRDKTLRRELGAKAESIAQEVEARLGRLEDRLGALVNGLDRAQGDLAEAHSELPTWGNWAAIGSTLLLTWIGLGQWALLNLGLRLLARRDAHANGGLHGS